MKTLRCLIVDDEDLARKRVRGLLSEEEAVQVVAEAENGAEALEAISTHRPDLVFLDIRMPGLSGFEVIEAIPADELPAIVFTTAYDRHAVQAFEVSAVDYLLKPFKSARFREALQRVRDRLSAPVPGDTGLTELLAHLKSSVGGPRVLVKSAERILFIRADEIDHVEAAGNYLVLHCENERHIVRETMLSMTSRLESAGFMRVSRSSIVNLSRVRELQPMSPGNYCVLMKSGARVDMTVPLRELQERMTS